ncbi:MAG: hypothetical protein ACRDZ4_18250 [Egibacteraceae bacterium]
MTLRGRYVVSISPGDVGKRVTVRSRTHAPPGEPSTTDTVGVLCSWSAGILHIERRDGTVAVIAEVDLLAARAIRAGRSNPSGPG